MILTHPGNTRCSSIFCGTPFHIVGSDRRIRRTLKPYAGQKLDWVLAFGEEGIKPSKEIVALVAEVAAGEERRL